MLARGQCILTKCGQKVHPYDQNSFGLKNYILEIQKFQFLPISYFPIVTLMTERYSNQTLILPDLPIFHI